MNRRLQQFLDLEQLSPARLASILGIQPSGISHILSGRNKPSFDFISNLLQKFPEISAEWLISGKGKPYKNQENLPSSPESPEIFDLTDTHFPAESTDFKIDKAEIPSVSPSENEKKPVYPENHTNNKSVKRITLFYSDGSFQEFYPPK